MIFEKTDSCIEYDDNSEVLLKKTGDFVKTTQMKVIPFVKPSKNRKGKYKEEYQIENRAQCIVSLRRTIETISDLINCNVTEENRKNCLWLTLTYDHLERDTKKIHADFSAFIKRLKRYLTKIGYEDFKYISVVEPQASGSFHFHVILIFNKFRPFIDNNEVLEKQLWKNGFTKVKDLPDGNIGLYLSAYLSDIEINHNQPDTGKKSKRIEKGARLYFYPAGMKIIRTSHNVVRPEKRRIKNKDLDSFLAEYEEIYRTDFNMLDNDGCIKNQCTKKTYKKMCK